MVIGVTTWIRFLVGVVMYVDALLFIKKISGIGGHEERYQSAFSAHHRDSATHARYERILTDLIGTS